MKALQKLFKQGEVKTFRKNEIILKPGVPDDFVYYIRNGYVIAYELSSTGNKKILHVLETGNIFPLASEIKDRVNTISVSAYTDVKVQAIDKHYFFQKSYAQKETLKELLQAVSDYLLLYVERLQNLELETIGQKVAQRLLLFYTRFGEQQKGRTVIHLPMTHAFIAASINVARENVSRELMKLQKENIIYMQRGKLSILDVEALKEKIQKK